MPRRDGTGPFGEGPMTGRGAGFCTEFKTPTYRDPIPTSGFGVCFGRGRRIWGGGRGWRNRFYAGGFPRRMRSRNDTPLYQEPDPEMEKQDLKNQIDALRSELDIIKKRLGEAESTTVSE